MLLRFQVRGYYFPNDHRHYEIFGNFATFDEAIEVVENMREDERAMAMFNNFVVREVY